MGQVRLQRVKPAPESQFGDILYTPKNLAMNRIDWKENVCAANLS